MRVTIAVDGVLREIEVRPDLLSPGMGEWQDATEMDLLRAFGSAYKEAAALRASAEQFAEVTSQESDPAAFALDEIILSAAEPDVEPDVEPDLEPDVEPVVAFTDAPTPDAFPEHVEGIEESAVVEHDDSEAPVLSVDGEANLYADIIPIVEPVVEPVVEETPFAAAPVEFAPVAVYAPSQDDAAAFLPPEGEHAATVAPVVTHCSCGHGIAWHPVSLDTAEEGACQMVWPIDDHEPEGAASRCSCLRFEPLAVVAPVD